MRFSCPYCHTHYRISRERIENRVLRIKCKVCHNALAIRDPNLDLGKAREAANRATEAAAAQVAATPPVASAIAGSAPAAGTPGAPPPPPIRPDESWYFADGRNKIGPLSLDVLQEKARHGTIGPRTYVWNPTLDGWVFAEERPELEGKFGAAPPQAGPASRPRIRASEDAPTEVTEADELGFDQPHQSTEIVDSEKAARLRSMLVANLASREAKRMAERQSPASDEPESDAPANGETQSEAPANGETQSDAAESGAAESGRAPEAEVPAPQRLAAPTVHAHEEPEQPPEHVGEAAPPPESTPHAPTPDALAPDALAAASPDSSMDATPSDNEGESADSAAELAHSELKATETVESADVPSAPDPVEEALESGSGDADTTVLPVDEEELRLAGAAMDAAAREHAAISIAAAKARGDVTGPDDFPSSDSAEVASNTMASDDSADLRTAPDERERETVADPDEPPEESAGESAQSDLSISIAASSIADTVNGGTESDSEATDRASDIAATEADAVSAPVREEDAVSRQNSPDAPPSADADGEVPGELADAKKDLAPADSAPSEAESAFFGDPGAESETLEAALQSAPEPEAPEETRVDPASLAALRETLGEEPAASRRGWAVPTVLAVAAGVAAAVYFTRPVAPASPEPQGALDVTYVERNEPKRPTYAIPDAPDELELLGVELGRATKSGTAEPGTAEPGAGSESLEVDELLAEDNEELTDETAEAENQGSATADGTTENTNANVRRARPPKAAPESDRALSAREVAALTASGMNETELEPIRPSPPTAAASPAVDDKSIARVFQRRAREVRKCAEAGSFSGKMVIQFEVQKNGKPTKPEIDSPGGVPGTTKGCIEALIGKLTFPAPDETISFQRTFILE